VLFPSETGDDVSAEQRPLLESVRNFRDLGGRRTAAGGRVRSGTLYRSGALHWLTEDDRSQLGQMGLRVVYDLRTEDERELAPTELPSSIRLELLPIGGTAARTRELWELVMRGEMTEVPPNFLFQVYESLAEDASSTFGRLFGLLASSTGTPGLIHCTAGKDRTGISVALLLSSLGVEDEDILDDYVRSAVVYSAPQMAKLRSRLEGTGIDVERYKAMFGAPREAMASFLDALRERYGSAQGYLVEEAGVEVGVFSELQNRFVEVPDGS
jgi:protein-tyrosine phosphatase